MKNEGKNGETLINRSVDGFTIDVQSNTVLGRICVNCLVCEKQIRRTGRGTGRDGVGETGRKTRVLYSLKNDEISKTCNTRILQ